MSPALHKKDTAKFALIKALFFKQGRNASMKNKIPSWPIYLADALIFIAVLLVAMPYYNSNTPMSGGVLALCAIMLFSSMLMALAPYWLDYKKDLATKAEHTREAAENFRIIFDDLSALRLGLAELEEKSDKLSETMPDMGEYSDLENRLKEFEGAVGDFRDSLKKRLREIMDSADSNAKAIGACESADKEIKNTIIAIASDVSALRESLQACMESSNSEFESIRSTIEKLSERHANASVGEASPVEADSALSGASDSLEEEAGKTETSKKIPDAKVGSMLNKALAGIEISKASVDKFVRLGMDAGVEGPKGDFPGVSDTSAGEQDPQKYGDKPQAAKLISSTEISLEEGISEPESPQLVGEDYSECLEMPKPGSARSKIENEDFFEVADSGKSESAGVASQDSLNFPEGIPEPAPKPQRPRKEEAVVTVNALIGIGNKPFLRGAGAGLSEEKGLAMEYVEIGKWRHVFGQLDSPLTFTVLKNDKTPANEGESFSISSGEKLELNLSFPQSD